MLTALMTGATTVAQTLRMITTVANPISIFPVIVSFVGNHTPARLVIEIKSASLHKVLKTYRVDLISLIERTSCFISRDELI